MAFVVPVYYMPVSFVEAPCAPAPEELYDQPDESPAVQYAPSVVPSVAPSMTPSADSACSSSTASDETVVVLANVCQGVGEWHNFEEGLWLRAAPLELLDQCYMVEDGGDYRSLGAFDFQAVANFMRERIMVFDEQGACLIRPRQDIEQMARNVGLRSLRCYPSTIGIAICGSAFSYLDAAWRLDNQKALRANLHAELVMALLRGKGPSMWVSGDASRVASLFLETEKTNTQPLPVQAQKRAEPPQTQRCTVQGRMETPPKKIGFSMSNAATGVKRGAELPTAISKKIPNVADMKVEAPRQQTQRPQSNAPVSLCVYKVTENSCDLWAAFPDTKLWQIQLEHDARPSVSVHIVASLNDFLKEASKNSSGGVPDTVRRVWD